MTDTKRLSKKRITETIYADGHQWAVRFGRLVPAAGRPDIVQHLFKIVGEKIPFQALTAVHKQLKSESLPTNGIYVAHDSMGYARYIGRGNIFTRLKQRKQAQTLELTYFSFYVVLNKKHEREIETILIRAAGPLLQFNTRKKRVTIDSGNIRDYEPRTIFFERQYKKGRPVNG